LSVLHFSLCSRLDGVSNWGGWYHPGWWPDPPHVTTLSLKCDSSLHTDLSLLVLRCVPCRGCAGAGHTG
jgi:hypothetical protein